MLEDPAGRLSLDAVSAPLGAARFQRRLGPVNLGLTKSVYWFRLNLDAHDFASGSRRWVISLGTPFAAATAYAKVDASGAGVWKELTITDFARTGVAPVAFELPPPGPTMQLLFRIHSPDTLIFAPRLLEAADYVEQHSDESLRKGAYYGILIGAIVYNLFLAIWLRDRSYVFYVLFEAAFCITMSCLDRTIIAVFPSLLPALDHGVTERLMNVTAITAVLFGLDFLDLRGAPRIRLVAHLTVLLGLVLLAIPESVGRQFLYETAYVFNVHGTIFLSFMAIFSFRRGNANAILFIVALGAILAATTLWSLTSLGLMMPSYGVLDSLRFGSAIEAMLLSVALARRMNRIKRAEEIARTELADARLGLSNMLQRQVTSLNTLVGGVAHEIGNPLNFAAGGAKDAVNRIDQAGQIAELVTSQKADSLRDILEAARRSAALAARGTERIDSIVKNLRRYVGAGAEPVKSTDLDDCVRGTIALLDGHLRAKGVDVVLDLALRDRLRCCPSEMNQVIMNLVLNASQAMPEGGTIFIRSEETPDALRIVVADTGTGVPATLRSSIFDPFFTTRAPNEGTGLGLSVSREIVGRHGGKLELLLEHEPGAAFLISLPRST